MNPSLPTGRAAWRRLPPPGARAQIAGAAVRLAAIGLVAIGASGVIAGGMSVVVGKRFVAGTPTGITYSAARCADYLEYEPRASSCEDAATRHHLGEIVDYRVAAGGLGVVLMGAYRWARRRWPRLDERDALPEGFQSTVGATAFGLAAVASLGQVTAQLLAGETAGAGAWLSAGVASAAVAAALLVSLYRSLGL